MRYRDKQRDREKLRETERETEGGRDGRKEGMKYSTNGLIVGHNNKNKMKRASGERVLYPCLK